MVTMKDVARHAEVSIATVSRVINKTGYVSPELIERVERAMHDLSYQPSAMARSLRRQESRIIGVLIPQLDHPFFSRLCFAIEKTLFDNDYRTFICSAEEDSDKEETYVRMLVRQRVDGVLMVPTGHSSENVQRLLEQNIPVILVDRVLPDVNTTKITSDNRRGGYIGMQHLLELGHRNIAVIGGPPYSDPMIQRMEGVWDALAEYGVDEHPELREIGSKRQFEMSHDVTMHLFKRKSPPTAIFSLTDLMAQGVMHAAAKLGLKLPDDLSIVGFDDIPLASYSIPPLTTVAQPIHDMGVVAASMLLEQIQYKTEPVDILLDTALQVRQSTAALSK